MKTITATLAALLLAGASTAALAQDREHDRADRADRAQSHDHFQSPQEGHARFGAPPPPQAATPAPPAAQPSAQPPAPARTFEHRDFRGRDGQPPVTPQPQV